MKPPPLPRLRREPAPLTRASVASRHAPTPGRRLGAALVLAALSLSQAGCPEPGDLENVQSFCKPGASVVDAKGQVTGCSGSASGGGSASGCETACIQALFAGTCKSCHSQAAPLGMLDLESAGVSARLKDQAAKHADTASPASCPSGDKLIDSATPSASWLLKKVSNQQGQCGTQMPPQGASADDVACVTAYVSCVGTGS